MKRIRLMTPAALTLATCLSVSPFTNAQLPVDTFTQSEVVTSNESETAKTADYTVGSAEGLPIEEAVRQLLDKALENAIPMRGRL